MIIYDKIKKAHNGRARGEEVKIESVGNERVVYDQHGKFIASYNLNDSQERTLYSQRYVRAV